MEYMQYIVSILAGLAAVIPLVIKLVEYVQKATKEKNWNKLVSLVIDLMQTAESKLGALIDSLCDMSKVLNINSKNAETKAK